MTRDGVRIVNVDNDTDRNAVQINNNSAGVIAGYGNGVYVYDVYGVGDGNGNVQINNDAYYDWMGTDEDPTDDVLQRGGLIVGVNEDGVYVSDIGGNLRINNGGTLGDAFD
ncbi:MAG: hypothetical protein K0Q69_2149, partial [Devosia sp.]|nr:hypothetical protein [Devosia sp.]